MKGARRSCAWQPSAKLLQFAATVEVPMDATKMVSEIVAGDNAAVEHVKLQDEATNAFHIATIAGEFGRTSHVNVHSFALGARDSAGTEKNRPRQ